VLYRSRTDASQLFKESVALLGEGDLGYGSLVNGNAFHQT